MPFAADALAAAVARQTGSRGGHPAQPGHGRRARHRPARPACARPRTRAAGARPGAVPRRARRAEGDLRLQGDGRLRRRGQPCRIDRLQHARGRRSASVFTWGGGCALYDKGTRKAKLPDRSPDPFRERESLVRQLTHRLDGRAPGPRRRRAAHRVDGRVHAQGPVPVLRAPSCTNWASTSVVHTGADQATLKRGIQEANVPFCAPMQLFHGLVSRLAAEPATSSSCPCSRTCRRVDGEPVAKTCPIVQASPDMIRWGLATGRRPRVLSPVIDIGPGNLDSREFRDSCRRAGRGAGGSAATVAGGLATPRGRSQAQLRRATASSSGSRRWPSAPSTTSLPVVVLGRPYTIYNTVLNSNVPALLREQGALAIPLDCYPVDDGVPVFDDMYLGLRPAHPARGAPDPPHVRACTASTAATTPAGRTASTSISAPMSWRASRSR